MRYLDHARGDRREPLFEPLAPLGWAMAAGQRLRASLYQRGILTTHLPPVPVISVGNLTFGGTNKTPVVAWLAERLLAAGWSVGIATRGYGRTATVPVLLHRGSVVGEEGEDSAVPDQGTERTEPLRNLAGDEPLMLTSRIPDAWIAVGRDRVAGVHRLAGHDVDVVVLDDGFQHLRLGRHLDLVLIDATSPFGNHRLLPAGSLREPLSALQRADQVLVTRSEQLTAEERRRLDSVLQRHVSSDRLEWAYSRLECWGRWKGQREGTRVDWNPGELPPEPYFVVSAIANPRSLMSLVETQGPAPSEHAEKRVIGSRVFPDHHAISRRELEDAATQAVGLGAKALVCTEKDLQNLPSGGSGASRLPIWVPRLQVSPESPDWFERRVLPVL